MLHFISSILDLYLTVCLICSKSHFWFPQDSHSTWEKTTKSRERSKGFTLICRVVSPLLCASCSYSIQHSLFSRGVTHTPAIKPETALDSRKAYSLSPWQTKGV